MGGRAAIVLVRSNGEGEEEEDGEDGHFAGEEEGGEGGLEVAVGEVGGGLYGFVGDEEVDDELCRGVRWIGTHGMRERGGLTICRAFRPMMPLKLMSLRKTLCSLSWGFMRP